MGLKDYFVFDGVASSDFNIYASGECTFNFPEKEYESHAVPGRSGDLQVFSGRYKNITVTYPCVYKMTGNDFARDIAGFREFLMSREGYLRLEDTHHPDEFRLGIFKGGLKLNPAEYGVHGLVTTFDIEFDCMPQRWLKYGEEPIHNPFMIENHTKFPSSPLLQIYGYGYLGINDYEIEIADKTVGEIVLTGLHQNRTNSALVSPFNEAKFNIGDNAKVTGTWWVSFKIEEAVEGSISLSTIDEGYGLEVRDTSVEEDGTITIESTCVWTPFHAGTESTWTESNIVRVTYLTTESQDPEDPEHLDVSISITMTFGTDSITMSDLTISSGTYISERKLLGVAYVQSTISSLGNPLYIDMETGDAYKYEDGELIYVNGSVWVGEKLAKLQPGKNWFMQDSTIPNIYVIPRWWTL